MLDQDHKKWIDILSFGAPIQRQQDDTPKTLAPQQDEEISVVPLLLPAVQSVRLSSASGEDFEFVDFQTPGTDSETAYVPDQVLVTSLQTSGSADRAEPEATLTNMPHDAPMPVDGVDVF